MHRTPVAWRDARRIVKAARVINRAPEMGESLASGAITAAHVDALARVMSPRREPVLAKHSGLLSKQAERFPVKEFTLLARRWASLADDERASDSHPEADPPRNELRAAVTIGGRVVGDFDLDAVAGAELLGALDPSRTARPG